MVQRAAKGVQVCRVAHHLVIAARAAQVDAQRQGQPLAAAHHKGQPARQPQRRAGRQRAQPPQGAARTAQRQPQQQKRRKIGHLQLGKAAQRKAQAGRQAIFAVQGPKHSQHEEQKHAVCLAPKGAVVNGRRVHGPQPARKARPAHALPVPNLIQKRRRAHVKQNGPQLNQHHGQHAVGGDGAAHLLRKLHGPAKQPEQRGQQGRVIQRVKAQRGLIHGKPVFVRRNGPGDVVALQVVGVVIQRRRHQPQRQRRQHQQKQPSGKRPPLLRRMLHCAFPPFAVCAPPRRQCIAASRPAAAPPAPRAAPGPARCACTGRSFALCPLPHVFCCQYTRNCANAPARRHRLCFPPLAPFSPWMMPQWPAPFAARGAARCRRCFLPPMRSPSAGAAPMARAIHRQRHHSPLALSPALATARRWRRAQPAGSGGP